MSDIAIKVENLSKAYQLGDFSTGTLSNDINRWWAVFRGKEDPFLKIGEANDRAVKGTTDLAWSLRDINFEIKQGDAVGIIGRNGAGKSTLLKLLSRVTSPTTGSIKIRGRIASLLEVGTGFHPDLTGRENIYLNGAILGMRKAEIKRQFDAIVDFAGVDRYIDTPVKRYSSGMYVRLAFAVAAHLQSETLIVDEVLAVGDAEFQKKCLGKMNDVSKGEGRTVLFVSHNMGMISQLCSNCIHLQKGHVVEYGNTVGVINSYLSDSGSNISKTLSAAFTQQESDEIVLLKTFEVVPHYKNSNDFSSSTIIKIIINFDILKPVTGLRLGFDIMQNNSGECIFRSFHDDTYKESKQYDPGKYIITAHIPQNLLNKGEYIISPAIGVHNVKWLSISTHKLLVNIININGVNSLYSDKRPGMIAPEIKWKLNEN
jgi:lipopolysaccharide transport system ATP-binding protein